MAETSDHHQGMSKPTERNAYVLPHRIDSYRSVVVDDALEDISPGNFQERLETSLDVWRLQGRRGVFLKLAIQQAGLIPIAVRLGFSFHHASKSGRNLVLTIWLPKDRPNNLPSGPTHFVGVAGVVMRGDGKILLVQEKSGPSARSKIWKLPGGLAEPRESIEEAVLREVLEETGVETKFVALTSVINLKPRKGNVARGGRSDLFCTCLLKSLQAYPTLSLQENEIKDAKWEFPQDVLEHGLYSLQDTVFRRSLETALSHEKNSKAGLTPERLPFGFIKGMARILRSKM
ncbi:hypothetical protein AAMO2058_000175900 [Amorphochlora amoebiformis]